MSITASQVKELRTKTGVSMMACKKALTEANGDEAKAIEILRKKGESKAASKSNRATSEGLVKVQGKSIISLKCETDFVARNDDFIEFACNLVEKVETDGIEGASETDVTSLVAKLGENITIGDIKKVSAENVTLGEYVHGNNKIGVVVALEGGTAEQARDVAMHIAAMNPACISPADVDDAEVEKEKEIWIEQLKNEGKPENIMDNILKGKEAKYRGENALLGQAFVKDPSQTVGQYLGDAKVVEFIRVEI